MSPAAQALTAQRSAFQPALLAWYDANRRRLPWREHPSLYGTVVSEFMLQQTQVATVLPYYARWLKAFPDFPTLAAAAESEVLKQWEGLGYYSRARNLQRLAQALVARPAVPNTTAEWQELPGIGPYTAAAISSIAQRHPAACVDGNVVRILARLTADGTRFRDSGTAAKQFTLLADELLARERPGDFNQAMMELGATVCVRRGPRCMICPVREFCRAGTRGDPEEYPRLAPKTIEQRSVTRWWAIRNQHLLLHRASATAKRLADLHELPDSAALGIDAESEARAALIAIRRRTITRFAITETIRQLPREQRVPDDPALAWVSLEDLARVTLSGPHRRWIEELLASLVAEGVPLKAAKVR